MKTFIRLSMILALMAMTLMLVACDSTPDAYDSYGDPINISKFRGKWLVVNYWASWCQPCYQEMPVLQQLSDHYNQKLVVLGINFEDATDHHLQSFAHQHHIHYTLVSHFPMKKLGITSVDVLPTTLIIDPRGRLIATLQGPQSKAQLMQFIHIG